MRKRLFLHNALLLTATALVLRAAGMGFRVWVANRLGDEGMGLYQLIFTLYNLSITLATTGISVASTRMTAGWLAREKGSPAAIAQKVSLYSFLVGCLVGMVQYFSAKTVCGVFLSDLRAAPSLRILAPSLPFMALGAALRGCFSACRQVQSSSAAQLFEQAVRIGLVMWLLPLALPYGEAAACAAVVAGNTISEALSAGYMLLAWRRYLKKQNGKGTREKTQGSLKEFGRLSLPVTATRGLSGLLVTAENVLVPTALAVKMGGRGPALAAFGQLKGMAMPVVFMPFSFLATLSVLLLPEVAEAHIRKDQKGMERLLRVTLRLTGASAVLVGGLITLFAEELGQLLYHSPQVAFYLRVLGPLAPFMYLESMVDGILRGLDEQLATFRYSMADMAVRICAVGLLVPRYGMAGYLFVMLFSNLFTCTANFGRLLRVTGLRPGWADLAIKPFFSVFVSAAAWHWAAEPFLFSVPAVQRLLIGGGTVTGIYLLFLWLTGCVGREELAALGLRAPKRGSKARVFSFF